MTSAEFSAAYRVLRRITHDGVRSYTAQHVTTQRPVMVHFLDGVSEPERAAMLVRLSQLEPTDRSRVHERLEVEGSPVVVTQILSGFASFPAWLSERTPNAPVAGPEDSAVSADRGVERPAVLDGLPAKPAPPAQQSAAAAPSAPAASAAPGEFTRLFSLPAPASEQRPAASAAPAAETSKAGAEPVRAASLQAPPVVEAGEFTRMFRPSVAPSQPPMGATPLTPPRASQPPATFPLNGGMPMSGGATGALEARPFVPPSSSTPPAPVPSPMASPTQFPPPLPPEFLNQANSPGATGSPPFAAPLPEAAPVSPRQPAGGPPPSAGPSEFTRIIAGPVSPGPARAATTPPPAVAPAAPGTAPGSASGSAVPAAGESPAEAGGPAANWAAYIPLLLVLNVIAIVAMGLIIYFAVKN